MLVTREFLAQSGYGYVCLYCVIWGLLTFSCLQAVSMLLLEVPVTGSRTCSFTSIGWQARSLWSSPWEKTAEQRTNTFQPDDAMPYIRVSVSRCSLCVSYSPGVFHLYCVYVVGKGKLAQRKGEKNSTFVFLAGVCVYTQTESHKKTGLEVETFLSSFITTQQHMMREVGLCLESVWGRIQQQ